MGIYGKDIEYHKGQIISSLNEAYVGKTSTLLELEQAIGVARNIYKDNRKKDFNTSPEILKLNRIMEKQFGMTLCAFRIIPNSTINAYTVPIACHIDMIDMKYLKDQVYVDNNGYHFKPGNNFLILVNIHHGLFVDPNTSDEELVGVILHEIGHNFADFLVNDIAVLNAKMMQQWQAEMLKQYMKKFGGMKKYIEWKKQNSNDYQLALHKKIQDIKYKDDKQAEKMADFFDKEEKKAYKSEVDARKHGDQVYKAMMKKLKEYESKGILKDTLKNVNRVNEIVADKFASVYGYGPALSKWLMKYQKIQTAASSYVDSLGSAYEKLNNEYIAALSNFYKFSSHPNDATRVLEQLKNLESDLKQEDLEPKTKLLLVYQAQELRKLIEDGIKIDKETTERDKIFADSNKEALETGATTQEIEDYVQYCFDIFFKKIESDSNNKNFNARKSIRK